MGLVTELVDGADLAARADALAEKIASGARQSASAVKKLVLMSFRTDSGTDGVGRRRLIAECADSPDGTEGMNASSKSVDRSSRDTSIDRSVVRCGCGVDRLRSKRAAQHGVRHRRLPRARRQGLLPERLPGQGFRGRGGWPRLTRGHDVCARQLNCVFQRQAASGGGSGNFRVLDRPGFASDRHHVYLLGRPLSDDPIHFKLLDANLSADSKKVYWSDGRVLSTDPAHFVIISNDSHYLFTRDSRTVHVNANPIAGADPIAFLVLKGAYARDYVRIFYFTDQSQARTSRRFMCSTVPMRAMCEMSIGWES